MSNKLLRGVAASTLLLAAPAAAQDVSPPNSAQAAVAPTQPADAAAAASPLTAAPPATEAGASAPVAAPRVVATAAVVAAALLDDPQPAAPVGFAGSFAAPARDADGAYLTPNRNLSAEEVTWHVRVALNVAALGCRDAAEAANAAAYNAIIGGDAAPLADAAGRIEAAEKGRWGADWQKHHDDDQTRLYNYFAQPQAQAAFCRTAEAVLAESGKVAPADFPAFAAIALRRLEAPFLAAFATWDDYRTRLANWRVTHPAPMAAPRVEVAAAAPVNVVTGR